MKYIILLALLSITLIITAGCSSNYLNYYSGKVIATESLNCGTKIYFEGGTTIIVKTDISLAIGKYYQISLSTYKEYPNYGDIYTIQLKETAQ